ncbi:MAG TPA: hypothetical protein VH144_02315 [Candidatus Saccharimonadales bacterium]|jgi:hypothetical protein|nr:hypothetical protein [Candidatus Saccharimonadales bacterium]
MSGIQKYKKTIIVAVCLLAVLWVMTQAWFYEPVVAFLLAGVLPGTSIILPAWIMLLCAIAAVIVLVRWLAQPVAKPDVRKTVAATRYHKPAKSTVTGTKRSGKKAPAKRTTRRRYARVQAS